MKTCLRCNDTNIKTRGLCRYHYDRYRYTTGMPVGRVSTAPVAEHVKRLSAAGIGTRRLAELSGVDREALSRLHKHPYTYAAIAQKVLSVPVPDVPHGPEVADGSRVPVLGTARRMRALVALGYTNEELGARLGMTNPKMAGKYMTLHQEYVTAAFARRVDEMFRQLQVMPPPDGYGNRRARLRAQRNGWAPPFAWDEDTIDDPKARPAGYKVDREERMRQYEELRASGMNTNQIARHMGIDRASLVRWLERNTKRTA